MLVQIAPDVDPGSQLALLVLDVAFEPLIGDGFVGLRATTIRALDDGFDARFASVRALSIAITASPSWCDICS